MDYKLYHQRRLPHYQPKSGVLFITFRLNFPIPSKLIQAYNRYADVLQARLEHQDKKPEQVIAHQKMLFAYADEQYNEINWEISLTEPEGVAELLADLMLSLHGNLYYLYAYTIMPNHVHMLIKPNEFDGKPVSVAEIERKIKGVSARQINLLLNRQGTLWFREYYDHAVRNPQEMVNIIEYIRNNPLKAKLVDDPHKWKWTWINTDAVFGGL